MKRFAGIVWWAAVAAIVSPLGCSRDDAPEPVITPAVVEVQNKAATKPEGETSESHETTALPVKSATGYGDVTGQFVLTGDVPTPELIVAQGDPTAKDSAVCAARAIHSEKLVVDADTKGIRHIFVYLRKALEIHPNLASSDQAIVVFDQKGCRFEPHTLLVRTDQSVVIKSGDSINHNTHTNPVLGQSANYLMKPNDREGVELANLRAESRPFKVNCDVHPWMTAWWLVLDHPYAAITDEQGRFSINKLPAGEHEFRVWHEGRYIDRKFMITVKADQTTALDPIELPLVLLRP